MSKFNMKVTPEIEKLTQICRENDKLDLSLYGKYDVKRGLRDLNGSCLAHDIPVQIKSSVKIYSTNYSRAA